MSVNNAVLEKKIFIKGKIKAITGLHIGGSSLGMSIGGADSVVIRNPINNQPYIPGSSLKGKMRSLMEKVTGEMEIRNGNYLPTKNADHIIGKLFGVSADSQNQAAPTRLIVRDAHLLNEETLAAAEDTDMPYTEVKTEVIIDRLTSAANPRQIERVPAGAEFELELIINVYVGDDEQELLDTVFHALELVEHDYLGGSGTRGYGKVYFEFDDKILYKDRDAYLNNLPMKELENYQIPKGV